MGGQEASGRGEHSVFVAVLQPFCVASMDLRCRLLDTPSSVGVGAGAEVLAGARALSRRVHQAPVHTGTGFWDISLFT